MPNSRIVVLVDLKNVFKLEYRGTKFKLQYQNRSIVIYYYYSPHLPYGFRTENDFIKTVIHFFYTYLCLAGTFFDKISIINTSLEKYATILTIID